MFVAASAFAWLGVSRSDDAMERANVAAGLTIAAEWCGVMLAYAGSNVGNGPTIWTTLLPAFVAAVALLAAWGLLESLTDTAEAITVERDVATVSASATFSRAPALCSAARWPGTSTSEPDTPARSADFARRRLAGAGDRAGDGRACTTSCARRRTRPTPSIVLAGIVPPRRSSRSRSCTSSRSGRPYVAPAGEYDKPAAVEKER
jgi:hypothetical protein